MLLVMSTVGAVFAIRLSRTGVEGTMYLTTTVVFCTELLKAFVSGVMIIRGSVSGWQDGVSVLFRHVTDGAGLLRVSAPCVLYTVQNNLLILALSNLSAAEYQVTYQLKILSTALMSVFVLGRVLEPLKWGSLALLTCGVTLIQWRATATDVSGGSLLESSANRALGLTAVLAACVTSGLGGVLMEKLVKRKGVSMWETNFQVAVVSAGFALTGAVAQDAKAIRSGGFFQGYTLLVLVVVLIQALSGFIIATVMKHADNILKCFGSTLAIIICCAISAGVLHEFTLDANFGVGTVLVLLAMYLYSVPGGRLPGSSSKASKPVVPPGATKQE